MCSRILRLLIPQLFFSLYAKFLEKVEPRGRLFDGDDKLFKELVKDAIVYGEYGCGKSTVWALNNCDCEVISVDTDRNWIVKVRELAGKTSNRMNISHIDVGEITRWGYPQNFSKRKNFRKYAETIWLENRKPDTVLIDGRFRVSCFLSCLKFAEPGTKIIFDDYVDRPHYHVVEEYLEKSEIYGRQAMFIVPNRGLIDEENLEKDIERFKYVVD